MRYIPMNGLKELKPVVDWGRNWHPYLYIPSTAQTKMIPQTSDEILDDHFLG